MNYAETVLGYDNTYVSQNVFTYRRYCAYTIRIRILELEDRLMDVIEISSNYENVPVPIMKQK